MINVAHISWNRWKLSQNLTQFVNAAIQGRAPQAWTGHGLEGELLAYFAQSRPKAILLHLMILLPILALNLLNPDGVAIPTGAFLIGLSLFASLFLSERWTRYPLAPSRSIFLLCEACAGLGWALVAGQSPAPQTIPDFAFFLFIPVALGGTTLAFSAGIELATPALLLPILGMEGFELLFGQGPIPPQSAALTSLLTGFFLYLGYRVADTTREQFVTRAEKDALIADLEQAKAHSDEARRRAEELNLAKSRFLATMSHELRTPLNAILGFSEVMESELLGRHRVKAYRHYAHDIHESGQMLLALIDEVLDLSRIEAGRYHLIEAPCSLADTVSECANLLQLRAHSRNLAMMMTIDPAMPDILADQRALRQITLNLVSNAIKFTPPGGEVMIRVGRLPKGDQFIQVTDTGPGIPAHEIPIILESFGRGSLAVKAAEQGSGLGLPIVRGLVTMHGGEFSIESREGIGTSVTVTLPPSRVIAKSSTRERHHHTRVAA
jgi:two-component system, cell cycle sensor histidine kinase PleC